MLAKLLTRASVSLAAVSAVSAVLCAAAPDALAAPPPGLAWTEVPFLAPRADAVIGFDGTKTVLFGGGGPAGPLDDTWTWDGKSWARQLPPSGSPIAEALTLHTPAAAVGSHLVFFTSTTSSTAGTWDTAWTWDGTSWSSQPAPNGPKTNWGYTWPAVAALGTDVYLLNGLDSELWKWDGTTWTLHPRDVDAGPQNACQWALIGSQGGSLYLFCESTTWVLTPAGWVLKGSQHAPTTPKGGGSPSASFPFGKNWMVSGQSVGGTWEWDGTDWHQDPEAATPSARGDDTTIAPAPGGTLVLFGGAPSTGGELGDTWVYGAGTWTQALPTPAFPPGGPVADAPGGAVLLEGNVQSAAQTWQWSGAGWTLLSPATRPPARSVASMATLGNTAVAFGGLALASSGVLGDTWTWDGTNWTQHTASHSPAGRYDAAMTTAGNKVLLFGGGTLNGLLMDTWAWDGTAWTQLFPAHAPPARRGARMAWTGTEVVLFGGTTGYPQLFGDTWTFDGTDWTQRTPSQSPAPSASFPMVAASGAAVMTDAHGDTWWWDGAAWNDAKLANHPSPGATSNSTVIAGAGTVFQGAVWVLGSADGGADGGGVADAGDAGASDGGPKDATAGPDGSSPDASASGDASSPMDGASTGPGGSDGGANAGSGGGTCGCVAAGAGDPAPAFAACGALVAAAALRLRRRRAS